MGEMVFVLLFVAAFVGMEGVAYLSHEHLMHGPLWFLHRSHHEPQQGALQWNDLFGVFFAIPSIALIYLGTHGAPAALPLGLGMTAYGAAYFLFHDVIVHQRLRLRGWPRWAYLERIVRAHLVHHRTLQKQGAVSFGFLCAPARLGAAKQL